MILCGDYDDKEEEGRFKGAKFKVGFEAVVGEGAGGSNGDGDGDGAAKAVAKAVVGLPGEFLIRAEGFSIHCRMHLPIPLTHSPTPPLFIIQFIPLPAHPTRVITTLIYPFPHITIPTYLML